jgi:hypothetical protein
MPDFVCPNPPRRAGERKKQRRKNKEVCLILFAPTLKGAKSERLE